MRPIAAFALATITAATIACGEHTGGEGNRNSGGAGGGGGSTVTQAARTTISGCLQVDEQAGGYLLRTNDRDEGSQPTGTSGATRGKNAGSVFTGRGGDHIANAPTIGGHQSAGQVYVVVPATGNTEVSRYAGKQVTIDGVLEGTRVLHASSISTVADECSVQSSAR